MNIRPDVKASVQFATTLREFAPVSPVNALPVTCAATLALLRAPL